MLKGKYEFAGGIFVWVTVEKNKIYIKLPHPEKFEIFAEDETNFFSKSVDVTIEFIKDKNKVVGIAINEGVRKTKGKKLNKTVPLSSPKWVLTLRRKNLNTNIDFPGFYIFPAFSSQVYGRSPFNTYLLGAVNAGHDR